MWARCSMCFLILWALMFVARPATAQISQPSSDTLIRQGTILMGKGDLDHAAAAFRKAIVEDPQQGKAYNMLGIIESRQGHFGAAIRYLKIARKLNPASPQTAYNLALAYFEAGDSQSAMAVLRAAPKGMRPIAAVDRLRGDVFVETGNYTQGIRYLRKSVEEDTRPGTSYDLGIALLKAGEQREAEAFLLQAVQKFPQSPDLRVALGIAEYMAGKDGLAERSFLSAAHEGGDEETAYLTLGSFYLGLGQIDKALAAYKVALAKDSTNAEAYEKYGEALARKSLFKEAMKAFRRSIQLDPQQVSARVGLGKVLLRLGQTRKARDVFEQTIHISPKDREAYYQLAQAFLRLGKKEQARRILALWNQMDPSNVNPSTP